MTPVKLSFGVFFIAKGRWDLEDWFLSILQLAATKLLKNEFQLHLYPIVCGSSQIFLQTWVLICLLMYISCVDLTDH